MRVLGRMGETDVAGGKSCEESGFVDYAPAGGVDQDAAALH